MTDKPAHKPSLLERIFHIRCLKDEHKDALAEKGHLKKQRKESISDSGPFKVVTNEDGSIRLVENNEWPPGIKPYKIPNRLTKDQGLGKYDGMVIAPSSFAFSCGNAGCGSAEDEAAEDAEHKKHTDGFQNFKMGDKGLYTQA